MSKEEVICQGNQYKLIFFVLVVVKKEDRFLLVHEQKHGQLWYLPAGRVEPGEDFTTAAKRETLEEAGIPIEFEGILRFEHSPLPEYTRVRVIFVANPTDDTPPKSRPDEESLEARWFTIEQIQELPLRGEIVLESISYVAGGGFIAPLSIIAQEKG